MPLAKKNNLAFSIRNLLYKTKNTFNVNLELCSAQMNILIVIVDKYINFNTAFITIL